mgnify:CR=1 FL=1
MKGLLFIHGEYGVGQFVGCYKDKVVVRFKDKKEREIPVKEVSIYDEFKQEVVVYAKEKLNKAKVDKAVVISIDKKEKKHRKTKRKSIEDKYEPKLFRATL